MKRAALLVLTACTSMAPRYERPKAPIPAQLPGGAAAASQVRLGEFVRVSPLRQLIQQALANNRDLRATALAIETARHQYRIQRAASLPAIDAIAAVTSARAISGPDNAAARADLYSASVGTAAWELDVWGRLKSLSNAAEQRWLSSVEQAKAARISLIGELATAYVVLAADRSRLAVAREAVEVTKQTMELTEKLVTGGTANRGDYYQVATIYQQSRADVALLTTAIARDRNALELLAGGPVPDALLPAELPAALDWFADVPVGLASSVLLERPDVLAAEHDLIAANADIGEARARFFPSLSLTANGGIASLALGALFTGPAAVFTIAPALALPLFRGGATRANLALTEAQKLQLVAVYEATIQRAFREVADALALRATIDEQLAAQAELVEAARKSVELAEGRYKGGIDPFLTTHIALRAFYGARSSLVTTQLAALVNRVTLYRVLGGGLN